MQEPRPYGQFGKIHSDEDAAAVEALVRSLTNIRRTGGLDSLRMTRTLPGGGMATAIDMGGVLKVIVRQPSDLERPEQTDGLAHLGIPMLFSGVVTQARVRNGEGVGLRITEQTRRRLVGYDPNAREPRKELELQRFVIEYAEQFRHLKPEYTGIYTFTQYDKLRPTWWSGAMAAVMQVVGGYGRQSAEGLPEAEQRQGQLRLPDKYARQVREQLINMRLPGYLGWPDKAGRMRCEYGAAKCHGVSLDSGGNPWLVQISQRGVYVMPLPVVPATTTKAFRDFVTEKDDSELLVLLDRFGGMPTGEGFPEDLQDFEAWRRAGAIIRVCGVADFYQHQAMYEACGFSFNSRGTEAFNTCWSYDSNGLMRVHAYKLRLDLQPAPDQGRIKLQWEQPTGADADRLDAYLARLYGALGDGDARSLAIKYKVRRATLAQLLARAGSTQHARDGDVPYWENLEMDPIAAHGAYLARVGTGPLYWPYKNPMSCTRLKFPERTAKGCESFLHVSPDYQGPAMKCDTVVWGCYVEDQLRVIKYFYDEREFQQDEQSTFEDHMIVGEWTKDVTTGMSGLMGHWYTTDFDDRQEQKPMTTHTQIVGTDMGFGNPLYTTPPLLSCVGAVSRARYYMHRTKTNTTEGFTVDMAPLVPVLARDCLLYAYKDATVGTTQSETTTQGAVQDPNSYELWCYDSIWHYMGTTRSGNKGEPRSKDGVPVYVDTLNYNPGEVSDFADQGNWLGLPPGGFLDVTGICGPYTSRSSASFAAGGVQIGGEAPGFEPFSASSSEENKSSGRLHACLRVAGALRVHTDMPHGWYWGLSPTEQMDYFYRDAVYNVCGQVEYASISETDKQGLRRRWGASKLADDLSPHHFIGVINE